MEKEKKVGALWRRRGACTKPLGALSLSLLRKGDLSPEKEREGERESAKLSQTPGLGFARRERERERERERV